MNDADAVLDTLDTLDEPSRLAAAVLRAEIDKLRGLLDTITGGATSQRWEDVNGVPVNVCAWHLPNCDGRDGTLLEAAQKARTK